MTIKHQKKFIVFFEKTHHVVTQSVSVSRPFIIRHNTHTHTHTHTHTQGAPAVGVLSRDVMSHVT